MSSRGRRCSGVRGYGAEQRYGVETLVVIDVAVDVVAEEVVDEEVVAEDDTVVVVVVVDPHEPPAETTRSPCFSWAFCALTATVILTHGLVLLPVR